MIEAARVMREVDAGTVIMADHGEVVAIVTDRDIAIRAVAGAGEAARSGMPC